MQLESWLRRLVLVGLFLILLTPLLVADSLFFPFITGKAFFFRIITAIIFAAWAVLAILSHRYRPHRSPLLISFFLFLIILILATAFGIDHYKSFWSNFERMEGLVSYLHLFAYFLVLISVFKNEKLWQRYFQASVLVSVIVGGYGIAQLLGWVEIHQGGVRVDATFGNAVYLAVYMLFHIFLTAWLWLTTVPRWRNFVYPPIIVLQVIILFYTATRGTILGLIGGAMVTTLILAIWGRTRPKLRKFSFGLLLILILLVVGFWLARGSSFIQKDRVLSRFANISLEDTTTSSRVTIWQMAFRGFRERPILGWGPENFNLIFNKYYEPSLWPQEQWFDRAHNIYLDWLTMTGLLGLLGYLSLYAVVLWGLWRYEKDPVPRAVFTGLLIGYAFQNIFIFDNLTSYLLFLSVLSYLTYRQQSKVISPASEKNWLPPVKYAVLTLVIVLIVSLQYQLTYKPFRANIALLRALAASSAQTALEQFKTVFDDRTFASTEAGEQMTQSMFKVIKQSSLDSQFKQEFASTTLAELTNTIKRSPRDARHYLFLGIFTRLTGDLSTSVTALEKAIELSPRKQTIYLELINTYLSLEEKEKALVAAKKIYEFDLEFSDARLAYILMLIYNRQITEAEALLRKTDNLDERFINAYVEIGEYNKVLNLWQTRVAQEPNNVQFRFSLAAAYLTVGQRTKSIAELEKAIAIDPAVKEQATMLIREIRAGHNPLPR